MRHYFVRLMLAISLSLLLCPSLSVADNITYGNPATKGVLPIMITAFADPSTGDVYPTTTSADLYVFSLFDTGSTKVRLDSVSAAALGGLTPLTSGTTTDVRINGMSAINPVTLTAPIFDFNPYKPQAEVQGVGVRVEAPANLAITLTGAPVANQVSAFIDYTNTITRGPYAFLGNQNVSGPDITFYQGSNSPFGYTPAVQVALSRTGTPGTVNGETSGERYLMYNVAFAEGATSVASPASGSIGVGTRFLYDTGTDVTLIDSDLAAALGFNINSPQFTFTVSGSLLPGFYLDSLIMTGLNGDTYTLLNVPVLVGEVEAAFDAVIGSNLFSQTKILFDGPGNTLGIGESGTVGPGTAVPEPSTMLLLGSGLLGLLGLRKKFKS
jgi:hypothetical protein